MEGASLDLSRISTLSDIKIEGPIKELKLEKEQLQYVDTSKATIGEFKVVDIFGEEIKNPFGKAGSKAGREAAEGETLLAAERNASKERGFFETMVRNAEGEVHMGKVAAIAVGTAIVGGAIMS